jgi:hypothetical protein
LLNVWAWNRRIARGVGQASRNEARRPSTRNDQCCLPYFANIGPVPFSRPMIYPFCQRTNRGRVRCRTERPIGDRHWTRTATQGRVFSIISGGSTLRHSCCRSSLNQDTYLARVSLSRAGLPSRARSNALSSHHSRSEHPSRLSTLSTAAHVLSIAAVLPRDRIHPKTPV